MAVNKAQTELQGLLDLQSQGAAAADNAQKLLDARSQPGFASNDERASFALPEALATAVGASWLLGPVGGLLLGVAQGILGKKERQGAIDAWANDMGVLQETDAVFNDELDRLAATTTNEDDLQQLSAMQTQKDGAMRMMASASPELQQQGSALLADFSKRMNDYTLTQETQAIAAEANNAQLRRDLSAQQYTRFTGLIKDYDSQSQGFEDGRLAANKARDALRRGNPVDLVAATRLAIRTVEPVGPLTDEDVKAYANIGNIRTRLESKTEEWIGSGAALTDPLRKEFLTMINSFERQNAALQMTRDLRFQKRGELAELPDEHIQMFNRVKELPVDLGGEFAPNVDAQEGRDAVTGAVTDAIESVAPLDGTPSLKTRFKDWYSGSGREERAKRRRLTN